MNLYEAQEFFKQANPGKKIDFDFDEKCHRFNELVMTDGLPNMVHHIECNKVKVTIEGQNSVYVPIQSHRLGITWKTMLDMLNAKGDVHIHPDEIKVLGELKATPDIYALKMKQLMDHSGLTQAQIEAKA